MRSTISLWILGTVAIVAALGFLTSTGCTRVPPGFVGIRVNLYGSQRGVEDFPIETGRVWYNRWSEEIYKFPTFTQNATWTKNTVEGKGVDESITFNSVEGAGVNIDVAVSYAIKAESAANIFVKLRQDADYITHVYMRSHVRDEFSRHASKMKVGDIIGTGQQKLLDEVKQALETKLGPEGFVFDQVSFIGKARVDSKVESAINATIEASQRAIEAENKVKQVEAEAEQEVAKAKGKSAAILAEAEAKAEANRKLTESLSPELLQYEALQKWNGTMPTVIGSGALPFIEIPAKKQ